MKSMIFSPTKNGNNYYVDINKKITGYAHPLLSWLYHFEKQNKSFDSIPASVTIEGVGQYDKETIQYYLGKIQFFKKYGLNSDRNQEYEFSRLMSSDYVEYEMANLNQLTFEVTDACNLNCTYCGYNDHRLSLETIMCILAIGCPFEN